MSTENPLAGNVALVTGASSGIGYEAARTLARDGASVAVAARRAGKLENLAEHITEEFEGKSLAVPTDVTQREQVESMVSRTVDELGGLDIVVNNAGTTTTKDLSIEELPLDQYHTVMDVNADGAFFTTQSSLPHIKASSGVIIFVGSVAGKYPRPKSPVYAATKWWTRGFALNLAGHVGEDGVGVSVINPSEVRTEVGKEHREELSKDKYDPGEVTEPSEVAEMISVAARQTSPNSVHELDIVRRDFFANETVQ